MTTNNDPSIRSQAGTEVRPEILAPAGDLASFHAAVAAGADAVYLGLKHFSARMEAENFSIKDLARMREFATGRNVRLYVAMNTLIKPGELSAAGRLADRLTRHVQPDALIVQDLGMIELARQVGFQGEIHLSTLANVSFAAGVLEAGRLGAQRVVLPRELSIDEIRAVADACGPEGDGGPDLEVFVHGALCYAVSGRCWWSSYMGGKSGLRGRCVQPCRRLYEANSERRRLFSCRDLSLDVLTRTLFSIPRVRALKIEGRKKGPHYVFYVTKAYRTLCDNPGDSEAKRLAVGLLEQSLGRPTTHYNFLPQRPAVPVQPGEETASGQLVGRLILSNDGKPCFKPRQAMLDGDLLRIGYEDDSRHEVVRLRRGAPKGGRLSVRLGNVAPHEASGLPVFLIDRREPELVALLAELNAELERVRLDDEVMDSEFEPRLPKPIPMKERSRIRGLNLRVTRRPVRTRVGEEAGIWLTARNLEGQNRSGMSRIWWWLPPVIWPDEEAAWTELISQARQAGAERFVLNAPWQTALFDNAGRPAVIWAGPFCNIANALTLQTLADQGFSGAIISPELPGEDILSLPGQSPIPLGVVISGLWPLCISRTLAEQVKVDTPFRSPKGEVGYARRHGSAVWVYPDWGLDLSGERKALSAEGFAMFVTLDEPIPAEVRVRQRPGRFNWDLKLL